MLHLAARHSVDTLWNWCTFLATFE